MNRPVALLVLLLSAPASAHADALILTHVTVIDGTGAGPKLDHSVEVRDGRITRVEPSGRTSSTGDVRVVDATGRFLIPGLWDMHVHTGQRDVYLPLYVANGVTGVRDMGGDLEEPTGYGSSRYVELSLWREAIERGRRLGPRMILAGVLIDGIPWPGDVAVANADEGREAVDVLERLGVDFIKVKSFLDRDSYLAIAAEARLQHLTLAGHVPSSVPVAEASDVGQRSIEHLTGVALGCSPLEGSLMAEMAAALAARDRPRYEGAEARARDTFDAERAAALFARFVRNGTWQVPTLVELRRSALGGSADDPRWKYLPASLRERWRREEPPPGEAGRKRFESETALLARMHEAGVPILAGTDSANPGVLPGFGLHDELELLVGAGLSPMEALQAATSGPARFLGWEADLGSIQVGKRADLVLLGADPLLDIANTRNIQGVVVGGRYLSRSDLDALLSGVEAAAR